METISVESIVTYKNRKKNRFNNRFLLHYIFRMLFFDASDESECVIFFHFYLPLISGTVYIKSWNSILTDGQFGRYFNAFEPSSRWSLSTLISSDEYCILSINSIIFTPETLLTLFKKKKKSTEKRLSTILFVFLFTVELYTQNDRLFNSSFFVRHQSLIDSVCFGAAPANEWHKAQPIYKSYLAMLNLYNVQYSLV